jgi:SAM-dependent methyltransferase
MSSAEVAQYPVLNRLLRDTLKSTHPRALLVLGCSTGNGFEYIDSTVTSRIVGVDINPLFLQRLTERFARSGFPLEVRCTDVTDYAFEPEAFDLVHAALVLEYIEWVSVLPRVVASLRHRGALSVVLQRPSRMSPAVTPTKFTSLRLLESLFNFVEPEALITNVANLGLQLEARHREPLESGKAFEVLRFRKGAV